MPMISCQMRMTHQRGMLPSCSRPILLLRKTVPTAPSRSSFTKIPKSFLKHLARHGISLPTAIRASRAPAWAGGCSSSDLAGSKAARWLCRESVDSGRYRAPQGEGTGLSTGLSRKELVRTAWASASTYRCTDLRGGSHDGRIKLSPQKDWPVNEPDMLRKVLSALEDIRSDFNEKGDSNISMADLVVLAGTAAVEAAVRDAGHSIDITFRSGRTDARLEDTDEESFSVLEPCADGFRNYFDGSAASKHYLGAKAEAHLVEQAFMLDLDKFEMTALVGGMRAIGANVGDSSLGVLSDRPGQLTNDFFVHLLDMDTEWIATDNQDIFEGLDRTTGAKKWTASRVDLVFGSNSELRAIAEHYAADDAEKDFVEDFCNAWVKIMEHGRF